MANIFVFGSNLSGWHGKGSALEAFRNHGAIHGRGRGPQGSSYAIPTKGYYLEVLPLAEIAASVQDFVEHAKEHPEDTFNVVKIGCGLAGFAEDQIAPMFEGAPDNVILPDGWREKF